jgi:hypothetical protein
VVENEGLVCRLPLGWSVSLVVSSCLFFGFSALLCKKSGDDMQTEKKKVLLGKDLKLFDLETARRCSSLVPSEEDITGAC